MASRAVWKGQLRLSLVSIPIEIHSARERGASISFRQIHEPSGKPVRHETVVEGIGPVDRDELVKGYETEDGDYVLLDPEEIDRIRLETRKTFELVQFVEEGEIAPIWFDRPYYVVPSDDLAEDAYRVVRDALRETRRTGLGQLTMRGKEYLCAVRPCGDGLLMETLHYARDIRKADPLFSSISDDPPEKDLLDVAKQLIERKTAPFDATAFEDHYAEALRALIDRKTKSKGTKRAPVGETRSGGREENVVDLMDALKKSLDSEGGGSRKRGGGSGGRGRGTSAGKGGSGGGGGKASGQGNAGSGTGRRKKAS